MDALIQAAQLILSLSLLVVVHEFGHFMFAKLFGARVEKFYLFFNPWFSLFKYPRNAREDQTEYGIGWIPFGGYVKISGMIDESMDKEQMAQEPQPYEFRSKKAWQRLLIMVGGVMMNLILAIAIYTGISYTNGTSYISNYDVVDGYMYSDTAKKMGFEDGDKILNVDGVEFDNYRQIIMAILFDDAQYVEVERDGISKKIAVDKSYFSELIDKNNYVLELRIPVVVSSVADDSPAMLAGLESGDKIVAIDSVEIKYFDELKPLLASRAGKESLVSYVRDVDGVEKEFSASVVINADSTLGFYPSSDISKVYPIKKIEYTLLESVPQGVKMAVGQVDNYIKQIKLIFTPETGAYKAVGSVVSMGSMFDSSWDWLHFWSITAFLSIILAVMNILPIPALDGGHVMFLLFEVITRRKPSDKFLEYAQGVGMILLIALMVLALGNDIYKLFQ